MIRFHRPKKEVRERDKRYRRVLLTIESWIIQQNFHLSQSEAKKLHKQLGKLLVK